MTAIGVVEFIALLPAGLRDLLLRLTRQGGELHVATVDGDVLADATGAVELVGGDWLATRVTDRSTGAGSAWSVLATASTGSQPERRLDAKLACTITAGVAMHAARRGQRQRKAKRWYRASEGWAAVISGQTEE